jgi:hypothetical protein
MALSIRAFATRSAGAATARADTSTGMECAGRAGARGGLASQPPVGKIGRYGFGSGLDD